MLLIDIDNSTVTPNFRPVDPPPNYGFLPVCRPPHQFISLLISAQMPSGDDSDAELTILSPDDVDDSLFTRNAKSRSDRQRRRDSGYSETHQRSESLSR